MTFLQERKATGDMTRHITRRSRLRWHVDVECMDELGCGEDCSCRQQAEKDQTEHYVSRQASARS